jgi:iron(III) transport system substrate-binding protein
MVKRLAATLALSALMGTPFSPSAMAQDAPALANASDEEKARIQDLVAQASGEGALSYWDTVIQPQTHDALAEAFKEHYGLPEEFEVTYTLSSSSDLVTKVDQAMNANRVTMDVASVASLPWVLEKTEAGEIMEYQSPRYEAYQAAFEKGLGKDGYFAFNGAYIFVPMWNADTLDFSGKSYKDVIGAVPEGRLSLGNVANSTSYLSTYIGQNQVLDQSFFKDLAGMDPSFLVRSEQIASRLVSGQDLMAYSGMPTRAYQFNQRGANLKVMLPEEGVVILPQATFILQEAPHPAAAKLWIDFILSQKGQQILVEHEALISGREGFKSPIPEYAPSIDTLNVIGVDWSKISTDDMQSARSDWVDVFNP